MRKILFVLVLIFALVGCSSQKSNKADMSAYNIEGNDIRFLQDDYNSMISNLSDKKEGIYFIGFDECPWCQEFVPVLNEVLVTANKDAYYIDVRSNSFTQDIATKLETFDRTLGKDSSQGSVPFLVVVDAQGQIKTHLGTVEGHNAKVAKMTESQRSQLVQILTDLIN